MSSRRSTYRKRQKPAFERFKNRCRQFTAFMFSNVGIILLVIFYTIGGAFIFQAIELFEYDRLNGHKHMKPNATGKCLRKIWEITREIAQETLIDPDIDKQWSFSGSFLYSLTVITTIGYGNISPKSDWGKLVTILYAIIGMPLFLLYLSNIGDVLAKSFKWIYSKVCLCRICPGVARRRIIRERRKIRRLALSKALQDMESHSSSNSSESRTSNTQSSESSYYSEETDRSSTQSMSTLEIFENDNDSDIEREIRMNSDEITVPLTVCVIIMISYILAGAILFSRWEAWNYLNGSYFCFISLSSIGFGDLVPGERVITADKDKVEVSFILCAVYLLLGMALIAMCFNLMQEQVIHNVRAIKRASKACFRCKR